MERRHAARIHELQGHWLGAARIWPGRDVAVLNVSAGGALLEGRARLVPGMQVDLQLTPPEGRLMVRGRVLRCYVSGLASDGAVRYRGAVVFDEPLKILAAVRGNEVMWVAGAQASSQCCGRDG